MRKLYEAWLAPLRITLIMTATPDQPESKGTAHGCGSNGDPYFSIGDNDVVGKGNHVAFAAASRDVVDAFYAAAIAAGGTNNGAP